MTWVAVFRAETRKLPTLFKVKHNLLTKYTTSDTIWLEMMEVVYRSNISGFLYAALLAIRVNDGKQSIIMLSEQVR